MKLRIDSFTVPIVELAAELGLDPTGLAREARQRGMPIRKRRLHPAGGWLTPCVRRPDADILRQFHRDNRATPEQVPDWLTAAQAAQALGLTLSAFYQRREAGTITVQRVTLYGPGVIGNRTRYNPVDIQREARRLGIRPSTPPRGTVTTRELAGICQMTRKSLMRWRQAGCPHVLTMNGDAHYYPDRVLAWMQQRDLTGAQMNRSRAAFIRATALLAAYLTQQERAA